MNKQLTRLPNDKIIFGICSGIAKYLVWDKTVVRIIFIFLFLITGFFPIAILYIIAYFIMPVDNSSYNINDDIIK